jgi:hypothetical protein
MLWITSKAAYFGVTDQDREVVEYLTSHGADCSITLSFLDYNRDLLSGYSVLDELYPMIRACAN